MQRAIMMLRSRPAAIARLTITKRMAVDRAYQREDLQEAYQAICARRDRTFDPLFRRRSGRTPVAARAAIHPERDSFTMTDAAMQVGLHDLDHLEQITRALAQR